MKKYKWIFIALSIVAVVYMLMITAKSVMIWQAEREISHSVGLLKVIEPDDTLGYRLKSNLIEENGACFVYPDSSKIYSICSDEMGNRATHNDSLATTPKGSLLFLGCSFTFGFFSDADSLYPKRISDQQALSCKNAAMSGYGFSQMLMRAEQDIPHYKPQVVFVQYSDWLIERSQSIHNITIQPLQISNPYFYEENGAIKTALPLYNNKYMIDILKRMPQKRNGLLNQLVTILQLDVIQILNDLTNLKIYALQSIGSIPSPTTDKQKIALGFFEKMKQLCDYNHCRLIIIGVGSQSFAVPSAYEFVNTDTVLKQYADSIHSSYEKLYHNWTANGKVDFDDHPNHFAHRKIADAVNAYLVQNDSAGIAKRAFD